MIYVSRSAGNPWSHWIIGLKIKFYYQTLPFWWKLKQEKAVLFRKKMEVYLVTLDQYLPIHPVLDQIFRFYIFLKVPDRFKKKSLHVHWTFLSNDRSWTEAELYVLVLYDLIKSQYKSKRAHQGSLHLTPTCSAFIALMLMQSQSLVTVMMLGIDKWHQSEMGLKK